jgi:hypothetical protein
VLLLPSCIFSQSNFKLEDKTPKLSNINNSYNSKIDKLLDSMKAKSKVDSLRWGKYSKNAEKAKSGSQLMYNYLARIKDTLARKSGGWFDSSKTTVEDDKNLEVSTVYFLNEGKGKILRDSLKSFINMMGNLSEHNIMIKIDITDPPKSKDGDQKTWEEYYWEGVPSRAAITELTKFQNDVRNSETEVISYLYCKGLGMK